MIFVFEVFLLTLLVVTAIAIVRAENLFVAVMLTSIFSLLMAVNFFVLDAADVALTEAAIGAGVTTVIFLSALSLTAQQEKAAKVGRGLALAVVFIATVILVYATFDMPVLGDPNAPIHQYLAPWFIGETPKLIDIPNIVTAVLGSYRGYDTLGEVFVVFTACIGVLFLLSARSDAATQALRSSPTSIGLRHHRIPQVVGRLILPFIILYGLYVQFHGEYGPGGGFQAGAIIATGIILYAILEGEQRALAAIPHKVLLAMVAGGALLYASVGVAGMLLGGNFLDYSVLSSNPVTGQQIGIILIEAGVGITVSGALLSIFHAFAARENN